MLCSTGTSGELSIHFFYCYFIQLQHGFQSTICTPCSTPKWLGKCLMHEDPRGKPSTTSKFIRRQKSGPRLWVNKRTKRSTENQDLLRRALGNQAIVKPQVRVGRVKSNIRRIRTVMELRLTMRMKTTNRKKVRYTNLVF